jgi:hypothetical protein
MNVNIYIYIYIYICKNISIKIIRHEYTNIKAYKSYSYMYIDIEKCVDVNI